MAKAKMKTVRIIALLEDRKRLLEHLQDSSLIQVKSAEKPEKGFSKVDVSSQVQLFERNVTLTEQALKVLDNHAPEKSGLLDSFKGRRKIDPDEIGEIASKAGDVINVCDRITELEKELASNAAEEIRINTNLAQLEVWQKLDIPLNTSDTKSTAVFIGTLPGSYDEAKLSAALANENPKLEFEVEIQHSEPSVTCAVIFAPISQKVMAEDALRSLGFSRPMSPTSRTPAVKAQRLREKSERLKNENEAAVAEIVSLADKREEIRVTQDYFKIRAEKYNVINRIDHSRHVFIIEGYVPEENQEKLEKLCNRVSTCHIEFGEAGDDAPVLLKNNRFAAPAQGILTMYSPPSREDIDPTPILAFFFYFFFGMMFSDAGYGLLMTVVIGIVLKVFKPDKKMRNNLKLFQYCGVSTFAWGLIFGSIFGDAPVALYNYFNDTSLTMKEFLPWPTLDPQKDALLLMVVSIAFGLVHILVGMGCKFYICLRKKDWGGAFFDTGLWMLLLVGIAVLAAGIFASPALVTVGAVISIACAVGLVLTQGRSKNGIVGKAVGGLASLYDITSYISDLLSYSRLLALGLTTGVMAQVFNMLSTMFGKSVLGFICLVIIFIVGHAVNIGLNALGSYVHTIRLQYVEMFSKFYEGGGEEFETFSLNSKYIKIQEDN
ncbi:MAG: V-type ATP synthase subunit I [Ruminococcus sp.]|nr:V-type ATP synthase subunit I [Ruminococcus sp.]